MIIHVMRARVEWDSFDPWDKYVDSAQNLGYFRQFARGGKLHQGLNVHHAPPSIVEFEDNDSVSIYWYEEA